MDHRWELALRQEAWARLVTIGQTDPGFRLRRHLRLYKLRGASPTSRVVASCCHSAMYLGFDDGKHWVDVYQSRVQGAVLPLQMRICMRFAPRPEAVPSDVPRHAGYPFGLIARLMAARVPMMLPFRGRARASR